MGFWKNVDIDMRYHRMSKEAAIRVNAAELDNKLTDEEKRRIRAKAEAEADTKIDSMR